MLNTLFLNYCVVHYLARVNTLFPIVVVTSDGILITLIVPRKSFHVFVVSLRFLSFFCLSLQYVSIKIDLGHQVLKYHQFQPFFSVFFGFLGHKT
jgi:Ni/Fe-hydrogenase subunit HybB-like protein